MSLTVNRRKIAELLGIHEQTVKRNGYPIIEGVCRDDRYDIVECFKFHYKEDWKYHYNKLMEATNEETN